MYSSVVVSSSYVGVVVRVVVVAVFVVVWSVVLVLVIVLGSEFASSFPQAASVPMTATAVATAMTFRRMTWEFLPVLGVVIDEEEADDEALGSIFRALRE